MITIHDDKLFAELKKKAAQPANLEVSESTDGNKFFVKSGNLYRNTYTVEVEYPERMNENVRTFKCSCCKGDGLCEHARAVIEYLEGLDEADEVVRTMRMQTEKYIAKICRKGEKQ